MSNEYDEFLSDLKKERDILRDDNQQIGVNFQRLSEEAILNAAALKSMESDDLLKELMGN